MNRLKDGKELNRKMWRAIDRVETNWKLWNWKQQKIQKIKVDWPMSKQKKISAHHQTIILNVSLEYWTIPNFLCFNIYCEELRFKYLSYGVMKNIKNCTHAHWMPVTMLRSFYCSIWWLFGVFFCISKIKINTYKFQTSYPHLVLGC